MQEINVFIYEALLRGATTQEEFGFQDCQKIEIFKATNRIKGGLIILAFFPPMLYWARGNIKILKPLFALLAFTTLRILEEYSFYLHYYSHAASTPKINFNYLIILGLLNTMLKFDTKKSFLGIETHLFVKYCVWQDILKQRKLIPAKKYTDLLFIRPIYLRFNDIRQKIKHWRHYFKRRQLQ